MKSCSSSFNSSIGLYKFGERYYDPTLGRWTQQDPVGGSLGDPNTVNRYVYANDDPVNLVDPSGKDATNFALCVAGMIGALIGFLVGLAQVAWAIGILSSPSAAIIAAAGGSSAVIINALLPGGALILGALVGYFTLVLTLCAASSLSQ